VFGEELMLSFVFAVQSECAREVCRSSTSSESSSGDPGVTLVGGLVAEFVLPTFVRDRVAVRLLVLSSAGVGWSGSAVCAVSCSVFVLYLIHMYVRITIIIHFVIFDFILLDRANCTLSLSLCYRCMSMYISPMCDCTV
jgi:hypothetical protein